MVDFPEPDGPTNAVVLPASKTHEKSFNIGNSGLVGYVKLTFSKVILPKTFSFSTDYPLIYGSTSGTASITS